MDNKGEQLKFFFAGLFCLVFVIFILPSLVNLNTPSESVTSQKDDSNEMVHVDEEIQGQAGEPQSVIVGIQGIQIKASGQDPIIDDFPSQPLDLKKEFNHRFNQDDDYDFGATSYDFSVPDGLKDMVHFWVQVFGKYGKGYYLFHHKDNVELFYSVLDLQDLEPDVSGLTPAQAEAVRNKALVQEKHRVQQMLLNLDQKMKTNQMLDSGEQKLAELFLKNPSLSIKEAAQSDNIRIQGGFAHRFKQAIITSGLYMKEMERIFREKNLPIELTRIPLIESAFNVKAYSSAGAAGLWQFIQDTGARYLKIDSIADERLDPIFSTYAAATHLKSEYNLLDGSWPLTINAYNTGPGRIIKAIKQLNSDSIEDIIRNFKDPSYQFYSRNYYPEFLAALYVYNNQIAFFGRLNVLSPLRYEVYSPNRDVDLAELASMVDLNPQTLKEYNPALAADVLSGDKKLPADYLVKVPPSVGVALAQAETLIKDGTQTGTQWYLAQDGDSLESISAKLNVPVVLLEKLNAYLPQEVLKEGTFIELPEKEDVAQVPAQITVQ